MSLGFSKANRLLQADEFQRTLATGTKVVSDNHVVIANKIKQGAHALDLSFLVSWKRR